MIARRVPALAPVSLHPTGDGLTPLVGRELPTLPALGLSQLKRRPHVGEGAEQPLDFRCGAGNRQFSEAFVRDEFHLVLRWIARGDGHHTAL